MKCIFCGEEITRPKAKKFCSHTCYERYNSRVKYYNNLDSYREKSLEKNIKRKENGYYSDYNITNTKFAEEFGISKSQLHEYGKKFLLENPEVVEVLRVINSNKDNVKSIQKEETKENAIAYKKDYYIKNADRIKAQEKIRRDKRKLNKNKN